MASGFGMFPGCGCRCSGAGDVLIWDDPAQSAFGTLGLAAVYAAMGLTVHNNATYTGTLSDYRLIFRPIAVTEPPWWGEISGATWQGRIHITAENDSFFLTSIAHVDSLSPITGINIVGASIDPVCDHDGTVDADDLTDGQATIKYAWTSEVSGGTTLSRTVTGARPWLARSTMGAIDFVIAGDSNHLTDSCGAAVPHNTRFLQNLWNVP